MTASNLKDETIDKLKDLAEVNHDANKGFLKAAELTDNPQLEQTFRKYADQRETFARELERFVPRDARDSDGSFGGKMHRWWMDLRESVTSDQRYNLLAEVERGEDKIKEMYEEVISETSGTPANGVLGTQYAEIKRTHDTMRAMRDLAKRS